MLRKCSLLTVLQEKIGSSSCLESSIPNNIPPSATNPLVLGTDVMMLWSCGLCIDFGFSLPAQLYLPGAAVLLVGNGDEVAGCL